MLFIHTSELPVYIFFITVGEGVEFQPDLGKILRSFKNTVNFQMSSVENEVLGFLPPPWDRAPADCSNQVTSLACSQITLFVCLLIIYLFTLGFRDWLSLCCQAHRLLLKGSNSRDIHWLFSQVGKKWGRAFKLTYFFYTYMRGDM